MSDGKTRVIQAAIAAAAAGITSALIALVSYYEGERLTAYKDPIGIPTICYGHTGPDVKLGMRVSHDQCIVWLRQDLARARVQVDRCYNTTALSQGQIDALTSAMFNIGPGRADVKDGLCELKNGNQPRLRQYSNAGRCRDAADQFTNWANAGGHPLPGLVKRRRAERDMYIRDCKP